MAMKKRVFSGIQPTGTIHIGNYLAAIRRWAITQAEHESIFCIVDLHAITVPQEPKLLKAKNLEMAGMLLAAGIDPEVSVIFVQSRVSAHAELAWILNCIIPMGWMLRMIQFKEKSQRHKEQASTGLFDYPALMAADILLYRTGLVPVGEDQRQHVELARDVAERFNSRYGPTFELPEAVIPEVGSRIMGLKDPTKKMSKTGDDKDNVLGVLDPPDQIRAKIMKAVTDPLREIRFDPERPGIHNLLVIYELFSAEGRQAIEQRFAGKGYAQFKAELAEMVIEGLRPLQARFCELMKDQGYIGRLLEEGADRIRPVAEGTLNTVKEKVGLGLPVLRGS
ncbi:MAG: tryptophan--tRNA ligase [Deltaproteobacteria bacterium]|jgi:tryptophanyl-tRNA synthetase|nr:tryptophan--tRNA ligase [Deltaproteobacteria bacterium]HPW68564.1 tryptophan--tRNA ligase [Deltaproteobacteria bacterium]